MKVIVTGGAGFVGGHACRRFLDRGDTVFCVDNFDGFYDPAIKRDTVAELATSPGFHLVEADIRDAAAVEAALVAAGAGPGEVDAVVHLAARAGVRPSLEEPQPYADVNVGGMAAVMELARRLEIPACVFGSSSSVYGNHPVVPFSEDAPADRPISPYAATKRAAELVCHANHHVFGLSVVFLRFFTAYGPKQRPDLAIHNFASLLAAGEPILVFGDGSAERDYTYVDDIVQGIEAAVTYARAHPGCFEIINLREHQTVSLARLIELLSAAMGVRPSLRHLPPQPGDVDRTFADIGKARSLLGYAPRVPIEEGIPRFVRWFQSQRP